MSQVTSERSSRSRTTRASKRREEAQARTSFLRLYGEFVDELAAATRHRVLAGWTHGEIAAKAGIDPAVLSRVLAGRAGTNLRTLAAVLNGTDHRMKMKAVPCEKLRTFCWEDNPRPVEVKVLTLHGDARWTLATEDEELDSFMKPVKILQAQEKITLENAHDK